MSNTEMNRQIVQEGLERKKTERKQRMTDAAHDAQERQLRTTINQHAQERGVERDAAQANAQLQEAIQREKATAKAQEEKDVKRTLRLTARIFGSLLYASLMTFAYIHEAVSVGVALATIGLATIYCIATFIHYAARCNRARREA